VSSVSSHGLKKHVLQLFAVALCIEGLAACATGQRAATFSTGPASSPDPTASASTSRPTGSASAVPTCTTAALAVAIVHTEAAGGNVGGYLSFTNRGQAPCQLVGWPEVVGIREGISGSSAIHVQTTTWGPHVNGQPVVTLSPGEHADAAFAAGDNPGPNATACPAAYDSLRVTPPGNTQPVVVSAWLSYANAYLPSCTSISVSMVVKPADLYEG
jgi:hypothetical protein